MRWSEEFWSGDDVFMVKKVGRRRLGAIEVKYKYKNEDYFLYFMIVTRQDVRCVFFLYLDATNFMLHDYVDNILEARQHTRLSQSLL
jgi:hypothetical protein